MIDKEEFEKASFEENQKFIKKILKLATHNAFSKDDLLFLIKWQVEYFENVEKEKQQLKAKIKILEEKNFEKCPYRCTDMGCDYCDWRDRDLKDEWEIIK